MAFGDIHDSNRTSLYVAEEATPGVLPGTPAGTDAIWKPRLPNSYTDTGGRRTTLARRPIEASRQLRKGTLTDIEALAGWSEDLTNSDLEFWQGVFMADIIHNATFENVGNVDGTTDDYDLIAGASAVAIQAGGTGYTVNDILTVGGGTGTSTTLRVTSVNAGVIDGIAIETAGAYSAVPANPVAVTGGTGGDDATFNITWDTEIFFVGDLLWATDFDEPENNGLKRATAVGANIVEVAEDLVDDASPGTGHRLRRVGFQFAAGDLDVDDTGTYPAVTTVTKDLTELGVARGDWVFIGGDTEATRFQNEATAGLRDNEGFCRVWDVTENRMEFDKTPRAFTAEASTTETIRMWFGSVVKNQADPALQVIRTYSALRVLGEDDDGTMCEIVDGNRIDSAVVRLPEKDKAMVDYTLAGQRHRPRPGTQGLPLGDFSTPISVDPLYNTSNHVQYRAAVYLAGDAAPTPLFAFMHDLNMTIGNNVGRVGSVGVLGDAGKTLGAFQVSATIESVFEDMRSIQAIDAVSDVTLDARLVKDQAGLVIDLPLLTLADGLINIEQDREITLPLTADAASGLQIAEHLDFTCQVNRFEYLPAIAQSA